MQPRSIVALGMVVLVHSLIAACSKQEPPEEIIRPVRYVEVKETPAGQTRIFAGTARAGVEANLSFKVGGTLQAVPVKVGDQVSKGSLIAELDPTDFELKLQETEAGLSQARAEQRNAQANYERVQALYENNNASRSELDAARASAESASATVRSIGKQLEQARAQLGYTRLAAKNDCSIASVDVEENENVSAGQRIAMVTCGAAAEVEVGVPENVIGSIKKDDFVTVSFNAVRGETFAGRVTEVGLVVGTSSTYPVTIQLLESDSRIRSGMTADVGFRAAGGTGIRVPAVAVGEDGLGRFVFVVEPAEQGFGVTRRRPVKIGELTAFGMEIEDGLSAGDVVVTAGVTRIVDGQKVKVMGLVPSSDQSTK